MEHSYCHHEGHRGGQLSQCRVPKWPWVDTRGQESRAPTCGWLDIGGQSSAGNGAPGEIRTPDFRLRRAL